jgi:hypothetical protein
MNDIQIYPDDIVCVKGKPETTYKVNSLGLYVDGMVNCTGSDGRGLYDFWDRDLDIVSRGWMFKHSRQSNE